MGIVNSVEGMGMGMATMEKVVAFILMRREWNIRRI
jgi:hypothetical protein